MARLLRADSTFPDPLKPVAILLQSMTDLARLADLICCKMQLQMVWVYVYYKKGGTLRCPVTEDRRRSIITQQRSSSRRVIITSAEHHHRMVSTTRKATCNCGAEHSEIAHKHTTAHTHTRTNNDPTYTVCGTHAGCRMHGRCGVGSPSGPSPVFSVCPAAFRHREAKVLSGKQECPGEGLSGPLTPRNSVHSLSDRSATTGFSDMRDLAQLLTMRTAPQSKHAIRSNDSITHAREMERTRRQLRRPQPHFGS